ncbi:MAG: TRAP transporter small permease [Burkholderiaceae bacterium]
MLAAYKRLLDRIGAFERGLGIGLILLMVTAITVQVFTRYVLGRPIAWVEESATYAFIWMSFVGASVGLKEGRHILIATFGAHLPPRIAAFMRMLVWALVLVTLAVLVVQGWKVMGVEGRSSTISLPIELPRSWFYSLPLTLSAVSMILTSLYLLWLEGPVVAGRSRGPDSVVPPAGKEAIPL